ncbi:Cytoskeletal protein syp1 [Neofusicoccum parvum]|uniref:Cytoskeletal protein syp1 n=1 Tax=Neofusicoccum parvum TaxID=310453 RepID=A0ACB5RUV1_9PEZI|nr:Cytoskeletal protein syp1 [Neofusicoccum parvum]
MELSRKDYPQMLESLQPTQAVSVFNERVKHITKVNADIADFLQERRRLEDAYAQGLRKLAARQLPDGGADLGVFALPWQRIIGATESLAESHHSLAQKLESDVERPLREFEKSDREMQAMSTISGNMAHMAKEIETAQKRADKLKDKGAKAPAGKVATASTDVENANQQWGSQAPFIFEKLQAVDESRINHLRDALTQFQTLELDQIDRTRGPAEQCLSVILDVQTADEVKTFALKTTSGKPKLETQRGRNQAQASSSLTPTMQPPPTPDDGSSQRSGSVPEDEGPKDSEMINGGQSSGIPQLQEPLQPTMSTDIAPEPQKDAEGYTVPAASAMSDLFSQAEAEAAAHTIRHPDLHEPGLNSSIVETVSTWFEHGNVTRAVVIGELALAYNPPDLSAPFGNETIRLENFPVLEKVAPNPTFVDQVPDKAGDYTVNLSSITRTQVAFKYQVHLDESNIASFAPIALTPAWKVEPSQTSVILTYTLNPSFRLAPGRTSITLSNVILVIHLDPTGSKSSHCQSKPVGTFSKDKSLIYWRLGDVTLSADQPGQQLRARFYTEAEAKPGNIEARWEISGDNASGHGSGLGVSQMVQAGDSADAEADPFADESAAPATPSIAWKDVPIVKKISNGTYTAV